MAEISAEAKESIRTFVQEELKARRLDRAWVEHFTAEIAAEHFRRRDDKDQERKDRFFKTAIAILALTLGFIISGATAAFYFFTSSIRAEAKNHAATAVATALSSEDVMNARAEIRRAILEVDYFDKESGNFIKMLRQHVHEWSKLKPNLDTLQDVLLSASGLETLKTELAGDERFKNAILSEASGLATGLVVASTEPCQNLTGGWTDYQNADGRFLLGVGSNGLTTYSVGQTGGAETVTLTEAQMPIHSHGIKRQTDINAPNDNAFLARGLTSNVADADTKGAGGGQPHNNMPPYIALYFCKKD